MSNPSQEQFPFISDIEESLLKAFMQDRVLWVDFKDHVLPEYFNNPANTKLFKIMKVFFDKYLDFPTAAQCLDIAKRKKYDDKTVTKIKKVYETEDLKKKEVDYLRTECTQFIQNNKIKNALLESVDLMEKPRKDIEEKKEDYFLIKQRMEDAVSWNPEVKLGTDITDAEKRYEELQQIMSTAVGSPWKELNKLIGGGVFAKELTLVGSSSSVGKSIFLDNYATHSWRDLNKDTLMITLEMSEVRKGQRMDAEMHNINASDILFHKDDIIDYYRNNSFNKKLVIKEFPTGSVSINHLKQYVYQLELYTGFIPEIIFIDYLDIMNPSYRTNNDYDDQGRTAVELRGWAIEREIPIVSATQLNRAALRIPIEDLGEDTLADSWKKMMTADTLIFLANTPEERIKGKINLKIGKARNGIKEVVFQLNVDYPKLKIYDLTAKPKPKQKTP